MWEPPDQQTFEAIKAALVAPTVLWLFDPKLPIRMSADTSDRAVGGILEQQEHGHWCPVAFYSRKVLPAEQRFVTREREC